MSLANVMTEIKPLVIYYSHEGFTEFMAKSMAEVLECPALRLTPLDEETHKGFSKYFWGGKEVIFKREPELEPLPLNLDEFDLLLIGTPVWAYSFTPPLRTFFNNVTFSEKSVAVFCTHEGGPKNTLEKMKKIMTGGRVIGENDFLRAEDPKDKVQRKNEATQWARTILEKARAAIKEQCETP